MNSLLNNFKDKFFCRDSYLSVGRWTLLDYSEYYSRVEN